MTFVRILLIVSAVLLSTAAWPVGAQEKQEEELSELRQKIETLQKELEKSEESKSEAADALRASERAISEANRKLFELSNERNHVNNRIQRLRAETSQLEARIEDQRQSLASLIRRQYLAGQPESLRLMLNRQSANDTARQLHYLSYVSRARATLINRLQTNLERLETLADRVRDESLRLGRLEKDEAIQKKELEEERKTRTKVLSKASDSIARQRKQISKLKRDEQRLSALIRKLAEEARKRREQARLRNQSLPDASLNGSAFAKLKGRLRLPVIGELTNRFGKPREDSGLSWKGLFIAAKEGAVVKAIAPGQIVYADWLRGFGNLLIVDHGGGYMSLYGNNEALLRRAGENIVAGDTIAAVGNTGGNAHSGLYFELRHKGKAFDPLPWVKLK